MQLGRDYTIRQISSDDKVSGFSAGSSDFQPLKTFLQKQASQFHFGNIAKTWVVVKLVTLKNGELGEEPQPSILAYITLIASEINIRDGYSIEDCPHANRYEFMPALKIARLAVDSRYRGMGIGDQLIALAIAIATDLIAPNIGCRFITTDAKKGAIGFYKKSGFSLLETDYTQLAPAMFLDILRLSGNTATEDT